MAKSKKRKVKRLVGTTPMDISQVRTSPNSGGVPKSVSDGMDTSEIVVTDVLAAPKNSSLGTAAGRVVKKGPQKRKAVKLRKEKALMKAISMIDKQERRLTKMELKKYTKRTLIDMD